MEQKKTNYLRFPVIWVLATTVTISLVLISVANGFVYSDFITNFLFGGTSLIELLFGVFLAVAVQKATAKTAKRAQWAAVLHLLTLGVALTIHIMLARNVNMVRQITEVNEQAQQKVHNNQTNFLTQLNQYMVNSRKLIDTAKSRERQAIRSGQKPKFQNVNVDTSEFASLSKNYTAPQKQDIREYEDWIKSLTKWLLYSLIFSVAVCFGMQSFVLATWEKDEDQDGIEDGEENTNP